MKLLTKVKENTIAKEMSLKARDIDVCLYNIIDGSLPKEFILDALMIYENKDGGFGNDLYIDNYNPNSSVFQVYEAFRIIYIAGFSSKDKNELYDSIINHAANYLYNRIEPDGLFWNPNTIENNNYAHSDIFEYNDKNKKLFGMHPTLAILGYTLLFFKETKAYYKKAYSMSLKLINYYLNNNNPTKYELISVDSFLNSIKNIKLFDEYKDKLENKLAIDALNNLSMIFDDDKLHPLDIIYLKNDKLDEYRDIELDYLVDSIASFGLWDYKKGWNNGGIYAEEDSAMIKWIGANSVNNYYLLKYFGRIE